MLAAAVFAAPLQAQTVFDATADFSITNGNPNGVWSYGWMPTDFSRFQLVGNPTADVNGDSPGWGDVTGFWKNLGGEAYGVPTGWLSLHPGGGEEPCVLRWTSPVSGPVIIRGRFLTGDAGTVLVAVRMNGQAVWQAVDSGEFDLLRSVVPGDTVDFAAYGSYWAGNTPLEATIALTIPNRIYLWQTFYTVAENASVASVVVLRFGPEHLNEEVTVDYTTVGVTAHAGEDYVATSGTLHFAAAETEKLISIPILNDALKESEEQFLVVLSNPTGGVPVGNSNTVVRIQDNDPGVRFMTENVAVSEDAGVITVEAQRGDDLNLPFTVDYTTVNETAHAGEDYVATFGTLHFAAGETEKLISIPILNDALKESEEQFLVVLSNAIGGVSLGTSNAVIRIQDNDPGVRFMTEHVAVREGVGVITVEVQRGDDLNLPFTVDYATVNENARAGEDYMPTSGTLRFTAEEANKLITITILDDALGEPWEQFHLILSNPTGGVSLGNSSLAIWIQSGEPMTNSMTYYANVNNPNPVFPYASWATAATNIQDAVDATKAGDTVLVTNGVYAVGGKQGGGIYQYPNRVLIPDSIRLESVNGPLVTTIEGEYRCVYLGSNAVLSGFTLTKGFLPQDGGGGVLSEPSGIVTNCIVSGNAASGKDQGRGGGVFGGTLFNCLLTNNVAHHGNGPEIPRGGSGGAVYGATLYNCTLVGNLAEDGVGGGASDCTLYNCTLTGNSASVGGGASHCTLYNCTLTGNSASWIAGGAYRSTLYNCTVTGNDGGGVINFPGYLSRVFNSIVYSNSGGNYDEWTVLNFSCTTPLPTNGVGNITSPPLFMDFGAGDFRLREESPCIDAGTNLMGFTMMATNVDTGEINVISYAHEATDMLGNTRFIDGNFDGRVAWDMGAYEFNPYRFAPTLQFSPEGFRFTVRGEPGKSVRIERSRDLVHWEFAGQVPIPASGQTLIDPAATTERQLFYRVIAVP